jgi:hypothetical protein
MQNQNTNGVVKTTFGQQYSEDQTQAWADFQHNWCCIMGMGNSVSRWFYANNLGQIWHLPRIQGIVYDFKNGW